MKLARVLGILAWLFAIIVLLIVESPLDIWDLELSAPVVYLAAAIAAVGAWPIVTAFWGAHRAGRRRVTEREHALRAAVNRPLPPAEHPSHPRLPPNDR